MIPRPTVGWSPTPAVRARRGLSAGAGLAAAALVALPLLSGCRLQETSLAEPEDIVIAEVVLQVGASQQLALLHRTLALRPMTVPGATVEMTTPGGGVVAFQQTAGSKCVDASTSFSPDTISTCYATPVLASAVVPGGTYRLRIQTGDGRVLTGTTTVPGDFELLRPSAARCYLAPQTLLPIEWTQSAGAWVYMSETRLPHIRKALDPATLNDRTLDVTGLSITAADTTIVFPSEFGLFDRGDESDAPVLLAIQGGLPAGVSATVTVAAADRNYVQWVRRGAFNPSGAIQIPSIQGDGTGVFGSMVPKRFDLTSTPAVGVAPCSS